MLLVVRNIIFAFLCAWGYYVLWHFAGENGTFALMSEWSTQNRLPGLSAAYPTEYTRLHRLDIFLRSLLTLFWPMVNGARPGSSLMCFYFAGQGTAAWILTVLEGIRRGNQGKITSYTTTFGLFFQGVGIAIVGPFFFSFSSLADSSLASFTARSESELTAIIPSTISGLIYPTFRMARHTLYPQYKIDAIRLWQFFPLLCYLSLFAWTPMLRFLQKFEDRSASESPKSHRSALRWVYGLGLSCAAISHIGTLTICAVSKFFPQLLAEHIPEVFHLGHVFVPILPNNNLKADSIGQGAHWFLQWDMILMFCTYVVWAYFAVIEWTCNKQRLLSQGRTVSSTILLTPIVKMACHSIFVGPVGAALLAMWERDEEILESIVLDRRSAQDREPNSKQELISDRNRFEAGKVSNDVLVKNADNASEANALRKAGTS